MRPEAVPRAPRPLKTPGTLQQGAAPLPSPEALAVADDLTFEALSQAFIRLREIGDAALEAADARDARAVATRLRQAIVTLRAACEVVAMLVPNEADLS
jgi:hypothetical protein